MSDDDAVNIGMEDDPQGSHQSVLDVELELTAVLGTTNMKVSQLLKMGRGAVLMLDTGVHDDVQMKSNGKLIATGEVVVLEDHVAVSMNKIHKRHF